MFRVLSARLFEFLYPEQEGVGLVACVVQIAIPLGFTKCFVLYVILTVLSCLEEKRAFNFNSYLARLATFSVVLDFQRTFAKFGIVLQVHFPAGLA